MNTLHHPHLMAADLDATIAFWRDGLGDQVIAELDFAGACNVFMRVGHGRLHLRDQPPRTNERSTVHHLGVQTDELEHLVGRLRDMGVSVTTSATSPALRYAMAEGSDGLLIELFQPDLDELAPERRDHFHLSS